MDVVLSRLGTQLLSPTTDLPLFREPATLLSRLGIDPSETRWIGGVSEFARTLCPPSGPRRPPSNGPMKSRRRPPASPRWSS
ncbi:hypothetical protein V8C26DRAFT_348738 [Trichoderma gracile]